MALQWSETLSPDQNRRLWKIVDELDEFMPAKKELVSYITCDAVIEFLQDQIGAYKEGAEKDETYYTMVKLLQELKEKVSKQHPT